MDILGTLIVVASIAAFATYLIRRLLRKPLLREADIVNHDAEALATPSIRSVTSHRDTDDDSD